MLQRKSTNPIHCWFILTKLRTSGFSKLVLNIFGVLGFLGCSCAGLPNNNPSCCSKLNVFKAAPRSSIPRLPEKLHCGQLICPPPYIKETLVNAHRVQFNPSNTTPSVPMTDSPTPIIPNLGTTGIFSLLPRVIPPRWSWKASVRSACTIVDVWRPSNDAQSKPNANDPNASVFLDIHPPSSGKPANCTIWRNHYGKPPSRRQKSVRPPRKSATT